MAGSAVRLRPVEILIHFFDRVWPPVREESLLHSRASHVEYMCMRAAMYLRVSTDKQKTDMQVSEVRRYVRAMGWHGVEYVEKESSVKHRPVFEELMDHAKQRRFDVVVVWKLDRIARKLGVSFMTVKRSVTKA